MENSIFEYKGFDCDIEQQTSDSFEQFALAQQEGIAPKKLKAPIFGMWEITSKCPQNCIYCYNSSPMRVEELSGRQLFDVADQIVEARLFSICLTGGEPTMRPEYDDLVRYLCVSGINVATAISGANITQPRAKMLSRYLSTVQISLDGSTAEIHDGVRRREGSYQDAINAIQWFAAEGVRVKVSFAASTKNIDDLERVYGLCDELGVSELRTQKLAISGKVKNHEDGIVPTSEQYDRYMQFINVHPKLKCKLVYGDPSVHITKGVKMDMVLLTRITSEGNVGITPYADIYFGNVKEKRLTEIFDSMVGAWNKPQVRECIIKGLLSTEDETVRDGLSKKIFIS
jgi:MoaA/NifB/PqqE/SkfB family radical SAM enzyme